MHTGQLPVPKDFGYPEKYRGFAPLPEQIESIVKACTRVGLVIDPRPAFAFAERIKDRPYADEAEGYAVTVAPGFHDGEHDKDIRLSAELLSSTSLIDPALFRQSEITRAAFARLASQQEGRLIIYPAQAGALHQKHTDREARATFGGTTGQFGLGFLSTACMIVAHPTRLDGVEALWLSCPGEEHYRVDSGAYDAVPVIGRQSGSLRVFVRPANWPNGLDHGAATGFLLDQ